MKYFNFITALVLSVLYLLPGISSSAIDAAPGCCQNCVCMGDEPCCPDKQDENPTRDQDENSCGCLMDEDRLPEQRASLFERSSIPRIAPNFPTLEHPLRLGSTSYRQAQARRSLLRAEHRRTRVYCVYQL